MYMSFKAGYVHSEKEYKSQLVILKQEMINRETKYERDLLKIREINEEKLNSIKESYTALSSCHDVNGIQLLNEQIRKGNSIREFKQRSSF